MFGPGHSRPARCLARSRFSSPGARRRVGAPAYGPTGPGPRGTPSPLARPGASSPTGAPGLPGPAASSMVLSLGLPGPRHCVRLRWVTQWWAGPARPARGWRCRRACAAAGVPAPVPAVAAAPASGRRGGGRHLHLWPGNAVHAGSAHPMGIVRRSNRRVGLAAHHVPARSGQPDLLRVPSRLAPPVAQLLARADQAAHPTGCARSAVEADDPRPGSGGVEQAADVSGITGDNAGVQLRSGVRNHASTTSRMPAWPSRCPAECASCSVRTVTWQPRSSRRLCTWWRERRTR